MSTYRTQALVLVAVIVLAGAAWLLPILLQPTAHTPVKGAGFSWELSKLAEDPTMPEVPRTGVLLQVGNERHPLGIFEGSCFVIAESSWTFLPGELSGVICWWAGGGSEVGVFEENGALVVRQGVLDEGTAETAGFRGDFKTILVL